MSRTDEKGVIVSYVYFILNHKHQAVIMNTLIFLAVPFTSPHQPHPPTMQPSKNHDNSALRFITYWKSDESFWNTTDECFYSPLTKRIRSWLVGGSESLECYTLRLSRHLLTLTILKCGKMRQTDTWQCITKASLSCCRQIYIMYDIPILELTFGSVLVDKWMSWEFEAIVSILSLITANNILNPHLTLGHINTTLSYILSTAHQPFVLTDTSL